MPQSLSPPNLPVLHRRARFQLGTLVEIEARHASTAQLAAATNAAFAAIAAVEARASFFRPRSELGALNKALPGARQHLSPAMADLLRLAMAFENDSDGAFNANLGARLMASGARPTLYRQTGSLATVSESLRWLDEYVVEVLRPVCLDLGGVAKGYAVDRAIQCLQASGCSDGMVNAGGDLRLSGARQRVAVRAPETWQRQAAALDLADCALASSAHYAAPGPFHGRNGAGVLGGREAGPRSISVLAPTCAVADALTKVVWVSGDPAHPSLARYAARVLWLDADHSEVRNAAA